MKENVIAFFIIIGVLGVVGALWYFYENPVLNPRLDETSYVIIQKWDMPTELEEISGIAFVAKNKIACVQDEDGIIFIYNLATESVEKTIDFAKAGDYEALSIVDSTAYVMNSNGLLHEIQDFMGTSFRTNQFQTPFSGKNNMESLTADTLNNRLLMAVKDQDPNSETYKGIYGFDLHSKEVSLIPIFKIQRNDPIFKTSISDDDGGNTDAFYPSDMAINPLDGNIYVLEAKNPRLLILDPKGKPIALHTLHEESFPQPEGITFAPDGTLYIANEGKNGMANILEVELRSEPEISQ